MEQGGNKLGLNTLAVHAGTFKDEVTGAVNTPIVTSTSYEYIGRENTYPRYLNTINHNAVAEKLIALENGEEGLITSSGMAAITSTLFAFLSKGDHVIFQNGIYGGTYYFIVSQFSKSGIEYSFTESSSPAEFEKLIKPNTKLIYLETPSNPLLTVTDIAAIAKIAKMHNLISVIDNTFATPVNQTPLSSGIDIVIHSGTKYLGGHSDLSSGAIISSKEIIERIRPIALNFGGNLNSQDLYLLERSLKTLALRVRQQSENALHIATKLEKIVGIRKVYYPGLTSFEGHEIAIRQMKGFGGMLSFELNEGINVEIFLKKLKLIAPALSLGGVESTICAPAATSHIKMTLEERQKAGIKDNLLRLSVGIEDAEDILKDILQAL